MIYDPAALRGSVAVGVIAARVCYVLLIYRRYLADHARFSRAEALADWRDQ